MTRSNAIVAVLECSNLIFDMPSALFQRSATHLRKENPRLQYLRRQWNKPDNSEGIWWPLLFPPREPHDTQLIRAPTIWIFAFQSPSLIRVSTRHRVDLTMAALANGAIDRDRGASW